MSKLKAVFFDLDDTLYTSFQAGDRYAYECMEKWAQETFGEAGHGFDAAFLSARKQLAAEQPDMPPIHDRVLFAQCALENMGLNAVPYARKAAAVYWDAVFASDVRSTFYCTKTVLPFMQEQGAGLYHQHRLHGLLRRRFGLDGLRLRQGRCRHADPVHGAAVR